MPGFSCLIAEYFGSKFILHGFVNSAALCHDKNTGGCPKSQRTSLCIG